MSHTCSGDHSAYDVLGAMMLFFVGTFASACHAWVKTAYSPKKSNGLYVRLRCPCAPYKSGSFAAWKPSNLFPKMDSPSSAIWKRQFVVSLNGMPANNVGKDDDDREARSHTEIPMDVNQGGDVTEHVYQVWCQCKDGC